ncbi:C-type lectin domain-containing protein [Caenorhabditis elegans]|uniref:C-type lectin domain-containing protein n=1 Tax=Caenorhabditis elegans TaxID=6239 RepID=O45530_CAEEL|nr:C-type lectin domain-containing protein [Caenorhabditis elegans]CAB04415.4 C-type lectin domain-containing protein [Caenorhabditis elegans]|eukprot:NP_001256730.2 C-type LECtin [Caenorhabditis elegans]
MFNKFLKRFTAHFSISTICVICITLFTGVTPHLNELIFLSILPIPPVIKMMLGKLNRFLQLHWMVILLGIIFEILFTIGVVRLTYFLTKQASVESNTSPTPRLLSTSSTLASGNRTCTDGFTHINNKCWKLVTGPKSRADADKTCYDLGGSTLFSIRNDQENQALMEFVKDQKVENLWAGLICDRHGPAWCTWDLQSGTTAVYNNFADGWPSNEDKICNYFMTNGTQAGKWASASCTETMSFVCELPATIYDNTCEYNYDNYCYTPYFELKLSSEAQTFCASSGSNLVSIHSANENRFVYNIIPPGTETSIGGVAYSDDSLLWYDGTPPLFTNMIQLENGNCLFLYNDYVHWFGNNCLTTKCHFVCKRRISEK